MSTLIMDLRFSLRVLLKNPGFAGVAIITLAVGIGSCTAIYSILNALLVQPLPFSDPDRVVLALGWDVPNDSMRFNVSSADFSDWQADRTVFEDAAAYLYWNANLTQIDVPQRLQGYRVTANMFSLLGVEPVIGRDFDAREVESGADSVVILSHRLWRNQLNADPRIVGRELTLNGTKQVVVGVMPEGFEFPQGNFRGDLWTPLRLAAGQFADRSNSYSIVAVARLKKGTSLAQAQSYMGAVYRNLAADHPDTNAGLGVKLVPFQEHLIGPARPALLALMGAVGLLLLVACANVANLLLVRVRSREREIAVRAALGAGRLRLIRQLCTENILLSLIACGLGVLLAQWMLELLLSGVPEFYERVLPAIATIGVDRSVLVFTVMIAVLTGLLFGMFPALASSRPNLVASLKSDDRGSTGPARRFVRQTLVAVEVAMSVLLLVGAGLMMRSFSNLKHIDTGFDSSRVISMRVSLPEQRYSTNAEAVGFFDAFLGEVGAIPAVQNAGLVNTMPFSTSNSSRPVRIEGAELLADAPISRSDYRNISPGYFQTMGMQLKRGRAFRWSDRDESPPVVIVNEEFVRKYLGDRDALGALLRIGLDDEAPWLEIVGVVNDIRHQDLVSSARPEMYVPYMQSPRSTLTLVMRTEGDPMAVVGAVREKIGHLDSSLPLYDIQTVDDAVAQSLFVSSMTASLMSGFATVALLLATVGLYGLISYTVSQRSGEIGIRLALGAKRRDVALLVLRSGITITLLGVMLGVALAFVGTRAIASQLHGVAPTDPLTYALVCIVLILVSILAHYLPVRKATKLDPMNALRYE